MAALVISAYPACGKSVFYKKYSIYAGVGDTNTLKVLDSDSSKFSWLYDELGNKTNQRNPDFPNNYIRYIKDNIDIQDIIFVSSNKQVREALAENKIPFVIIYPKDTLENMIAWKKRFLNRGNNLAFVGFQMEHWSEFISEMRTSKLSICKVHLDVVNGYPYITKEIIDAIKNRLENNKDVNRNNKS